MMKSNTGENKMSEQPNLKLQVFKGLIQYLLDTTDYTLNNIAEVTNSSIKNVRAIYEGKPVPPNFSSELQLVELYNLIVKVQSQTCSK